jgi:hypothetical protein
MGEVSDLLKQTAESKTLEKAYEDSASPLFRQIGAFGGDLGKTARLLLFPLQITATLQDRLAVFLQNLNERVAPQQQIPIRPEIAGPAIEAMQYLELDNPLWQMFEELLIKSADSEQISKVHPSFVHMLKQLSRDEAYLLYKLTHTPFEFVYTMDLDRSQNRFVNRIYEKWTIPNSDLFSPESVGVYYSHLESMSLISWPVYKQEPVKKDNVQVGTRGYCRMHLTDFGHLFASACIPPKGVKGNG